MDTRFLHSSTFRLALIYMLLFGSSVLVVIGEIEYLRFDGTVRLPGQVTDGGPINKTQQYQLV